MKEYDDCCICKRDPCQCRKTPKPLRVIAAIFGALIAIGGLYFAKQIAFPIQDHAWCVRLAFGFLGFYVALLTCALAWTFIEFSIKGDA